MEQGVIKKVETDGDIRILTVEVRKHDVTTVDHYTHEGCEYIPPVGSTIHFSSITREFEVTDRAMGVTGSNSDLKPGERESFAEDGKNRKATITQRTGGEIELNHGSGFAVEFQELKSAFDEFVKSFNSHAHVVAGTTAKPIEIPITTNVDKAKVDKVKL